MTSNTSILGEALALPSGYAITTVESDQIDTFTQLAHASFPNRIDRWAFDLGGHNVMLTIDGVAAGGLVLDKFMVVREQWGKVVSIFTLPQFRGRGVAKSLVEYAFAWFQSQQIQRICAFVEGDNTNAATLFIKHGFGHASFGDQIKYFGASLFTAWSNSNFMSTDGYYMYIFPLQHRDASSGRHFATEILFTILCLCLGWWRLEIPWPQLIGYSTIATLLVMGLRTLFMVMIASLQQWNISYRMSESSIPIALLAGLGSILLPIPGNVYLHNQQRHHIDRKKALGLLGIFGTMGSILAILIGYAIGTVIPGGTEFRLVLIQFLSLIILDTLMPFLKGYQASRIWAWSRRWWLFTTIIGMISILLVFLASPPSWFWFF